MLSSSERFKSWDRLLPIILKNGRQYRVDGIKLVVMSADEVYPASRLAKLKKRPLNTSLEVGRSRYAVVVSKKVAGNAVIRNRIRRRVYEWIRLNKPGRDGTLCAVFIYRQDFARIPQEQLAGALREVFAKLK